MGTAKDTIHSLQTLVSQKNESIEQYRAMIDKLLAKLKEQQSKYSQHMNAMQSKYNADQQKNDDMIMSQIQKIESQNSNRDGSEEWIQMSQIKTTLKENQKIGRSQCCANQSKATKFGKNKNFKCTDK